MSDSAHDHLCKLLRENAVFSSIGGTIGWDEQTQLPPAGTDLRADQSAMMAGLSHERQTSQVLSDAIAAAEAEAGDDLDKTAVARDARRDYDRATKLPADLVEAIARAEVVGHHAWVEARKNDDFQGFEPHLKTMLDLKRKEAECVGYDKDNGGHIYNALLDDYEPGETRDGIETVFNELKNELIELVGKVQSSGKTPPRDVLTKTFPVTAQNEFSRRAAQAVGFDFDAGRLDIAVHPFCTGLGPGDTRMTTRFVENDLGNSFYSTLHETGHAMYEQGLPKSDHFGNALAESISLGIHESQSRMWENLVGRSEAFWDWAWPV
ncbi:MAG: carboxypeptidase M32, partial [Planctomycetota bacterium]